MLAQIHYMNAQRAPRRQFKRRDGFAHIRRGSPFHAAGRDHIGLPLLHQKQPLRRRDQTEAALPAARSMRGGPFPIRPMTA